MSKSHPIDGAPSAFPTECAGAAPIGTAPMSDEDWAAVLAYSAEPITDGRKVPPMFARIEAERWNGARVRPIVGRGNDQGSTGRALTACEESADLERAADAWLLAADYPTDRPDVVSETVDMSTFLPYWETQGKADRAAWRGAVHYQAVTHQRGNVKDHPETRGDRTRAMTWARATGRRNREAVDVTYVDPYTIGATWTTDEQGRRIMANNLIGPRAWQIAWQTIVAVKSNTARKQATRINRGDNEARKIARAAKLAQQESDRQEAVRKNAPMPNLIEEENEPEISQGTRPFPDFAQNVTDTLGASLGSIHDAGPETSVYGRPVTVWTAAARSLPRILNRASEEVRQVAADLIDLLATPDLATLHADGVDLEVTGDLVDDGVHGPMRARHWAQRAALAGVTID